MLPFSPGRRESMDKNPKDSKMIICLKLFYFHGMQSERVRVERHGAVELVKRQMMMNCIGQDKV